MLGRTAGGLFWAFRYLERSDNVARLIDAGLDMAQSPASEVEDVWKSVLTTAGVHDDYQTANGGYEPSKVINFLLGDPDHPASVLSMIEAARNNARMVRTALTRETWEATNECWLRLSEALSSPVKESETQHVLELIHRQSALVHGSLHATMLRDDNYSFCRLGTAVERAAATARIVDVKYYVLLPSAFHVGGPLDNAQWEIVLRSVSARHSFLWLNQGQVTAAGIVDFLVLDRRMPRSLAFCAHRITRSLSHLDRMYGEDHESRKLASEMLARLEETSVEKILGTGLHDFLLAFDADNAQVAEQIATDFRFYE